MKQYTATIERYKCFGTPWHHLRVTYKGRTLNWHTNEDGRPVQVYADAIDWGRESIDAMKAHAKKQGFTHVRIAGDWEKMIKPKGGKL